MLSRPSSPAGARRDPHRKTEAVVAQVDLGQAVDLAGFLALQADQPLTFGDGFLQALVGVVVAQACAPAARPPHRRASTSVPRALRQTAALSITSASMRAKIALWRDWSSDLAVRLLQQTRHRRGREMRQAQALAGVGHEHG